MTGWQPVETAPDETDFLAWVKCATSGQQWMTVARRIRAGGYLSSDDGVVNATHWMPLPDPPEVV